MKTRYIAAILLAFLTTALLLSSCKKSEYKREITEFGSFPFAEADFDENIYEDSEYMAKERALRYTSDDGTSVLISDERYTDYGDGDDALFFAKYLKSIIDGDAELYRSYHTERFLSDTSKKYSFRTEKDAVFAPQKLYNIEVEKVASEKRDDVLYRFYIVRYLIFKNNGTYRNDGMLDTSYIPLMITLTKRDGDSSPLVDRIEFLSDITIAAEA